MRVAKLDPGQGVESTWPGDFILTHRHTPYSWLVKTGQKIRFRGADRPYAHWSHAAFVVDERGGLVEALGHGVVRSHISKYKHVEYHYVDSQMVAQDRAQAVRFVEACVGEEYGWTTIASLAFTLLVGSKVRFPIGLNGTEICSGLVARALERGQYIWKVAPNLIMPADLAKQLGIKPIV